MATPIPLLNPRTGMPIETYPDEVRPEDLQIGSTGLDPASPAAQLAAAEVAAARAPAAQPITPEPPPLEAPPDAPPPAAVAPPPLTPKPAAARPAVPPKPDGEAKARAAEKEAGKGALAVAQSEQALGERKATAEQDQAAADQAAIKAHYDDVDRRTAAGMEYLQKQQDKVANFKIRDMYQGHDGAAIAAALMEGLGAFGAALTGGPNHAAAVIERGRQEFRQKQMDELEGLNRGVANAKERIDLTHMELASREAGMFKRLAADRAANMARFGFDQARIEGDKVYQDLVGKQAEAERTWQSMLHTRGQTEKLQASQIAENYASAEHSRAEANKANTEAAAGPKDAGRAAAVQIQKAQLAEHGAAALETIDELTRKGVKLTNADLETIQNNSKDVDNAKHAGSFETILKRESGYWSRSRYQGLPAEKQRLAQALDVLAQKSAAIASPSHAADEIESVRQTFALQPGDSAEAVRQKLDQMRGVIGSSKGLGGHYTSIAQQGAQAERAAAPQAGGADQVTAAKAWLSSPAARQDPAKAAAVAKKLHDMGAL